MTKNLGGNKTDKSKRESWGRVLEMTVVSRVSAVIMI